MTAFLTHGEAGHGWPVDAHYKEAIAVLARSPNHDQSSWADGDPGTDKAETLYEECAKALKAVIFLEGLADAHKEYNDGLANVFTKNSNI
jgi:hypothetical protein